MSVRVRFAPSPTGMLHVGALRTVLFDHLFAKRLGGQHFLRIEDTDRNRYDPTSEAEFIQALHWVGIDFDEGPHIGGPCGPYRQSERKEAGIYQPWIEKLLASGHAYKAFDTPEELQAMRDLQQANKQAIGYFGGMWRDASAAAVEQAEREGRPFVIRQRMPRGKKIVLDDAIRGRVEFNSDEVDDTVLIKADGMPTYHFAAMVDDHLMGTTHILRGEEWLSSAPKHVELFDMFGWERPVFVHCPVIKGKDGKKLSKRHGATRVLDYRSEGFLPGALKNFIALIGWAPGGDREIMSEAEMIEAFSLSGLQPSPGLFDYEKLRWMNGQYIRALEPSTLLAKVREFVSDQEVRNYWAAKEPDPEAPQAADPADVLQGLAALGNAADSDAALSEAAVQLNRERVDTLADFGPASRFLLEEEPPMDEKAVAKWLSQDHVPDLLDALIAELSSERVSLGGESNTGASAEWCESIIRNYAEQKGFDKLGPVVHPTRVALTGKTVGPGLFELMAALGPERMIVRLRRAKSLAGRG